MLKHDAIPENQYRYFIDNLPCRLPDDLYTLYKESNGAEGVIGDGYLILWPLSELIDLNRAYNVEKFAPDFFLFGSDGGDIAYGVERNTIRIYQMPFIGMSEAEAELIGNSLSDLLDHIEAEKNSD